MYMKYIMFFSLIAKQTRDDKIQKLRLVKHTTLAWIKTRSPRRLFII